MQKYGGSFSGIMIKNRQMNTMLRQLLLFSAMLSLSAPAYAAAALDGKAPIEITSDTLEVDQEAGTATFTGNVVAIQKDINLKSQKMIVHYTKSDEKGPQDGSNSISKIEVIEKVFLSTPQEAAQGDRGLYDVVSDTIHLSGNVVLKKDKNIVRGTALVYNMKTGKSRISSGGATQSGSSGGRVKGLFVPKQ